MLRRFKDLGARREVVAFFVACLMFLVLVYTTNYRPVQIAPALVLICGIYIGRYPKGFLR
jgi:hypothetical protein